jgi:HK97 family phage prohead protease
VAALSTKQINDLPDSVFGYIESGGKEDKQGKTVPRSKRHYPVHDPAHVRNALSRIGQGAKFGKLASPAVLAAARKFNVKASAYVSLAPDGEPTPPQASTSTDGRKWQSVAARQERVAQRLAGRSNDTGLDVEARKRKAELLATTLERRTFSVTDGLELRQKPGGNLRLVGYASVTGFPYEVGHFQETIERGAFKRTLGQNCDVGLLLNQGRSGSGLPLARTGHNMVLAEDDNGLRVEADLDADDPDVHLLARKMDRGLVDEMSIAFRVPRGGDEWTDDYTRRTIREVNLHKGDVSVVDRGANEATIAMVRSRATGRTRTARMSDLRLTRLRQEAVANELRKVKT